MSVARLLCMALATNIVCISSSASPIKLPIPPNIGNDIVLRPPVHSSCCNEFAEYENGGNTYLIGCDIDGKLYNVDPSTFGTQSIYNNVPAYSPDTHERNRSCARHAIGRVFSSGVQQNMYETFWCRTSPIGVATILQEITQHSVIGPITLYKTHVGTCAQHKTNLQRDLTQQERYALGCNF